MIFTQEAPLTRKWLSGRSCIRSNWNKLGVNFEEGGNRSARRKPSKSGWDRLKLNPYTTFVVEVEGVFDVHCASLTSQGVQHRVFYLDGHPSRYQPRPAGLNFGEQTGTSVFPLVIAVPNDGRVTLQVGPTFVHINTLARPARSTRSRRNDQSMCKHCCHWRASSWLGQSGQLFLSNKRSLKWTRLWGCSFSPGQLSPYKRA